jgi:chloride channel protein, CIC family
MITVGDADQLPDNYVFSDETCRTVAEEMATTGSMSLLVVDRETNRLLGSVGAAELLAGRRRAVKRESDRSIAFQFDLTRPL